MSEISLLQWQNDVLKVWIENKGQGIVEAPTGSGKTYLALKLMQSKKLYPFTVIVPSAELMRQWKNRIMKYYPERGIMLIGDGNKLKNFNVDIKIVIINSVRREHLKTKTLILDEIHHTSALAQVNHLVWKNIKWKYILGMSASVIPESLTNENTGWSIPSIYQYTLQQAYADGVLLKPKIITKSVELEENEQDVYNELTEKIKENSGSFGDFNNAPVWFKKWTFERNEILFNSKKKLNILKSILVENSFKKCIIFTERIDTADEIAKEINNNGIECLSLHSNLKKKERNQLVSRFINSTYPVVLTTAHLFEEGMDVPEVDLLVLYSFGNTRRESLQRIGRSLHNKVKTPNIYILYYKNTKEFFTATKIKNMFR